MDEIKTDCFPEAVISKQKLSCFYYVVYANDGLKKSTMAKLKGKENEGSGQNENGMKVSGGRLQEEDL